MAAADALWRSLGLASGSGGYYVIHPKTGRIIACLSPNGEPHIGSGLRPDRDSSFKVTTPYVFSPEGAKAVADAIAEVLPYG